MGESVTDKERWAEQEAVQFERNADYLLETCLPGWLERGARSHHPDSYKMCYEVALKAQAYRDMARQLRQPRYIREEQEAYAKFYGPTPDRSGEADETRSGSAEGESGLPGGSSS